jgi:Amidohydrolase
MHACHSATEMAKRSSTSKAGPAVGIGTLPLSAYRPLSQLRAARHSVERPSAPIVDAHTHLGRWLTGGSWAVSDVRALVDMMDGFAIRALVNFDGRWGDELQANLDRYDRAFPGRFATFCHADWSVLRGPRPGKQLRDGLARAVDVGSRGLKVWKDLGLEVRDEHDVLVTIDDPRLAPLWEMAGERNIPVAIHAADPVAFFEPVDERNERLEELLGYPDWSYADPRFPRFEQLIGALERLVAGHPATTFIGLHAGCYAENVEWISRMLDTYPNFNIDIGARINELGRQPRAVRDLLLRHPTRVLFATDAIPPDRATYDIYARFLETADESFPYSTADPPPAGRWEISGLDLPADVLRAVYSDNAARVIGV